MSPRKIAIADVQSAIEHVRREISNALAMNSGRNRKAWTRKGQRQNVRQYLIEALDALETTQSNFEDVARTYIDPPTDATKPSATQ